MNIFYLSHDTEECARYHVDRHVVKMILEYSQILSTAHRVLDGKEIIKIHNGRKQKQWFLDDKYDTRDTILYKATHINHPSSVWARYSAENYQWLVYLLGDLHKEYHYRYGKTHASYRLYEYLKTLPTNLYPKGFTEPTLAMPDEYKLENAIDSYRNYYRIGKKHLHSWKNRQQPDWI